jgi:hypothetical protein
MPNGKPKFIRKKSDSFRDVFVTGIFGGHRPDHFEIVVQSSNIDAGGTQEEGKPVVNVIDEICLKMTPFQAKLVFNWFDDHVKKFEKEFGEIKIGKKGQKKDDKSTDMYG